jgi:uncharacterized membrane protein
MKWLLYALAGIGGLLVVAVVTLLVLGGGRGESTLQTSVEIGRPAPVVFSFITEPARVKSWLSWLVEIQLLTPETTGVGSRQVWVMQDRNNNNQLMNIDTEITGYEANRLLQARVSAPLGFTGVITYELEPIAADRTRLKYQGIYQFEHWLAKLLSPVIARSAQQKLEDDLARLKQQAEAS